MFAIKTFKWRLEKFNGVHNQKRKYKTITVSSLKIGRITSCQQLEKVKYSRKCIVLSESIFSLYN